MIAGVRDVAPLLEAGRAPRGAKSRTDFAESLTAAKDDARDPREQSDAAAMAMAMGGPVALPPAPSTIAHEGMGPRRVDDGEQRPLRGASGAGDKKEVAERPLDSARADTRAALDGDGAAATSAATGSGADPEAGAATVTATGSAPVTATETATGTAKGAVAATATEAGGSSAPGAGAAAAAVAATVAGGTGKGEGEGGGAIDLERIGAADSAGATGSTTTTSAPAASAFADARFADTMRTAHEAKATPPAGGELSPVIADGADLLDGLEPGRPAVRVDRARLVVGEADDRVVVSVAVRHGTVDVSIRADDHKLAHAMQSARDELHDALDRHGLHLGAQTADGRARHHQPTHTTSDRRSSSTTSREADEPESPTPAHARDPHLRARA